MDEACYLVLSTCPDEVSARHIANALVQQKLAACVNLLPKLQSIYRWQGHIETNEEVLLLIKTTQNRYPALEQAIRSLHPYELPEIIAVPIEAGLPGYLDWLRDSLR